MMNKKTWLTVAVIVIFLGGALGLVIWNESRPVTISEEPTTSDNLTEGFTLEQISEHAEGDDCWVAIEGNVYDLTDFVEEHPGGSRSILAVCGIEATGSFNSMPPAVMPAARAMLAKYKIGSLAE